MIVVDTSAFISITIADVLDLVLAEYDVHTTQQVIDELEATAEYDDVHGTSAETVLTQTSALTIHEIGESDFQTSRIDDGEASCIQLARRGAADFLITDDLRALPELQQLTDAQVAISPILLRALVKRDRLTNSEAEDKLDVVATSRDWLGAPIYRRARGLFDE